MCISALHICLARHDALVADSANEHAFTVSSDTEQVTLDLYNKHARALRISISVWLSSHATSTTCSEGSAKQLFGSRDVACLPSAHRGASTHESNYGTSKLCGRVDTNSRLEPTPSCICRRLVPSPPAAMTSWNTVVQTQTQTRCSCARLPPVWRTAWWANLRTPILNARAGARHQQGERWRCVEWHWQGFDTARITDSAAGSIGSLKRMWNHPFKCCYCSPVSACGRRPQSHAVVNRLFSSFVNNVMHGHLKITA